MEDVKLREVEFKDELPLKTVARIKKILSEYNIETKEEWGESGVPHCKSLRLSVVGTDFGVNGKGLTESFTLASAYGELIERLQLGLFGPRNAQKSGQKNETILETKSKTVDELMEMNGDWYEAIAQKVCRYSKVKLDGRQMLNQFASPEGEVRVLEFYNLTKKQAVYFPLILLSAGYGSNGCAAGNTMPEAIVQALGEIMERYYKMRILEEQIATPEIPEEVLQKFQYAYSIITYLREKGCRVIVKDCSLGGKFPVVCVCFVDAVGRYHVHFGANPVLQIAIERALTETFQGRTEENFCQHEDFEYRGKNGFSVETIFGEFRIGTMNKEPEFFGKTTQSYNSQMGFEGKNNAELLPEVISYLSTLGWDVLVYDGATLGFPSCQVVIPGCSEQMVHNLTKEENTLRFQSFAIKALRNPSGAGLQDYIGLFEHMTQMKKLSGSDTTVQRFANMAKLTLRIDKREDAFYMASSLAYIYYALGNLPEIYKSVSTMTSVAPKEHKEELLCMKRYFSMLIHGYEMQKIQETLEFFHRKETVQALFEALESGNPFDRYTLHCAASCEGCPLIDKCGKDETLYLVELIKQKRNAMQFEPFAQEMSKLV